MPDALINRTPAGWPYLDEDNYLEVIDNYTLELATKLQNGEADVAAAINAASKIALSGWTTIATGFDAGVNGSIKFRSWGYAVEVEVELSTSALAQGANRLAPPGFVPSQFRPSAGKWARFSAYGNGGHPLMAHIGQSGELGVTNRSTGTITAIDARCLAYLRST